MAPRNPRPIIRSDQMTGREWLSLSHCNCTSSAIDCHYVMAENTKVIRATEELKHLSDRLCTDTELKTDLYSILDRDIKLFEIWSSAQEVLQELFQSNTPNVPHIQAHLEFFITACRVLRNSMVNCPDNQEHFSTSGFLDAILLVLTPECLQWLQRTHKEEDTLLLLLNLVLQCCGNAIVQHPENRSKCWHALMSQSLLEKLVHACPPTARKVRAVAIMMVHNCLKSDSDQRWHDLIQQKALLSILFRQCTLTASASLASTDDDDPYLEWMGILVDATVQAGRTLDIFDTIGARSFSRCTPEQLIFVHLLKRFFSLSSSNCCSLIAIVALVELHHRMFKDDEDSNLEQELLVEAQFVLLEAWGQVTTEHLTEFRNVVNDDDVALVMRSLIKSLASISGKNQRPTSLPHGYACAILRVLGNLCFQSRVCQDHMREFEGIVLLMNHCHIDLKEPFLREWAIVAIRHVCEDNRENQQFIEALRPQSKPEIDFANLEENMTELTRQEGAP